VASDVTAERYQRFVAQEARGRSALYEEFALGVADDNQLLQFLESLPLEKRQPNLVFASVRFALGTPGDYAGFRSLVLQNSDELREVILSHTTQTNEPGRCATLLPILAALPQPLALLEPGCSAGLCLLLDRYAYDYSGRHVGNGEPVFPCRPEGEVPIPQRTPEVAWRAGIDAEPLDVTDAKAVAWLEALVWPDQTERLERLRAALRVARHDPPPIHRGDALELLERVALGAPSDTTLVIFHSAFLPYLTDQDRLSFVELVKTANAVWVSNEAFGMVPGMPERPDEGEQTGAVVLGANGKEVAIADNHGAWMRWL
jgi:hypothetical protein